MTSCAFVLLAGGSAAAQQSRDAKPTLEIYGVEQADAIIDLNQNDPDWYDVSRPSTLPARANQFGANGRFYLSPRQSLFGITGVRPASHGDVQGTFEFDLFGLGRDAGQTTINVRNAWGQWKQLGAGQTDSQFADPDVFPNVLDYWGPPGTLDIRNTQLFWRPYQSGESTLVLALEQPGGSGDRGVLARRVALQNVKAHFPAPDLTGHYRLGGHPGYVQVGAALRYIGYDDVLAHPLDLSGHVWGWGVTVSSSLKAGPSDVFRLQAVCGEGVENYFNDAPVDVGAQRNPGSAVTPVVGKALPVLGLVAYLDHRWSRRWTTAAGYSRVDVSNSDLQAADAFRTGQYGSANLLATPAQNVTLGGEAQWARRQNFADGFSVNDFRVQFSFKYNFSYKVGG